jgi:hypothetical protein
MTFASQGSRLAITCHTFWDPTSCESGYFSVHFLLDYLRFTA